VVDGGAIALGRALATLCIGGAMGIAMCVERD
jgi:acetyl-CoA acetyltransferase